MQVTDPIWTALQANLDQEHAADQDTIARIKRCTLLVQTALSELKEAVLQTGFQNAAEEINFFKNHLPRFYGLFLHYSRILHIETRLPFGKENQLKFLEKEIKRLLLYFEQNAEWVQYFRSGATYLDEQHFLRKNSSGILTNYCPVILDQRFSSPGTYPFAKIQSLELTQHYLDQKISTLQQLPFTATSTKPKPLLRWTASKSDLIELLYALHSSRLFNNDEHIDVRQIATWLESTLHIDLGNYYRVFQGIRIRKKNRTQFLDTLKENLIQRMDDADEYPRN